MAQVLSAPELSTGIVWRATRALPHAVGESPANGEALMRDLLAGFAP
jgi:hypothetical protein